MSRSEPSDWCSSLVTKCATFANKRLGEANIGEPSIHATREGLGTQEAIEVAEKELHQAVVFIFVSASHVRGDDAVGLGPQRVLGR
jgi:hypothetical protein